MYVRMHMYVYIHNKAIPQHVHVQCREFLLSIIECAYHHASSSAAIHRGDSPEEGQYGSEHGVLLVDSLRGGGTGRRVHWDTRRQSTAEVDH